MHAMGHHALRRLALVLATSLASFQLAHCEESRIWTDKSGKFEIRAKFVDMVDGKVRLERPNGDISRISLEKLSEKDQDYVRNWKPATEKPAERPQPEGPRRLAVGDRVDAKYFGDWLPGIVTEIDYRFGHATVKLDNGRTAHHCGENKLRWPGTREAPLLEAPVDPGLANLKVVEPNLNQLLRVTADAMAATKIAADPMPAGLAGWKPRPVRLDGAASVHIRIEGFSVACESRPLAALVNVDPFANGTPPQIEFVDLASRRLLVKGPALPHTEGVMLSPSGNRIATLSTGDTHAKSEGRIDIWTLSGKTVSHVVGFSPYAGESWSTIDPEWMEWVDDEHLLTANREGRIYLWQADSAKAVYEILCERQARPALSPGRKQLAVPTVNGIDLFDSRNGEMLAHVGSGNMRNGKLAFSPSGRQIAAISSGFVDVVDVTNGELTRSFPCEKINGSRGISWVDEDYLLVDLTSLIHVPLRVVAWEFETASRSTTTAGGVPWIVMDSHKGGRTINPLILPPPGVTDAIDNLDQEKMLVVRPGAEVSIRADMRDRALALAVTSALKEAVRESGMKIVDDAPLVLRATMKKGKPETITYRRFGDHFGSGETMSIAPRIYELQLLQNGTKIWQRESVQSSPMHLRMEKGENTRAAINRVMQPTANNFRGRLPTYIVRPEFQGPFGTSRITGS